MGLFSKGDINVKIAAQDATATAFKSAENRMKGLANSAKSIAGALGGVFAGRAIFSAVQDAIQYGSQLTDAATATQTNIEALQVLRAAARDAGADQTKLENALVRAQKAGIDAANGLSTYTRAFAALNINVEQYNRLPTEKKLEAIAFGMRDASDQQAAYAAAMDILGTRNAPKLMEVLQRIGKEGYGALAAEIGKTNRIMSETDAKNLDAAADSIARMQQNLTLFTGEKVSFWLQFFDAVKNGKESVNGLRKDVEMLVDLLARSKGFTDFVVKANPFTSAFLSAKKMYDDAQLMKSVGNTDFSFNQPGFSSIFENQQPAQIQPSAAQAEAGAAISRASEGIVINAETIKADMEKARDGIIEIRRGVEQLKSAVAGGRN